MIQGWPQIPWDWEPSIVAGCVALAAVYLWALTARRFRPRWPRVLAFLAGDAVLLLALVSPLDTLGDHYLFSAHMVQHLLLLELAAPLLLLGVPAAPFRSLLSFGWAAATERRLRRPALAWTIGFATVCLWHLPTFYDATLRSEGLHIFEHLSFLVTAAVFWWPVLAPLPESRLALGTSIFYLYARMSANLALGTLIAAAPLGFYTAYLHAPPAPGPLRFLTPALDQRWGGFLMWIPSLALDAAAVPLLLALWQSRRLQAQAVLPTPWPQVLGGDKSRRTGGVSIE